MDVPEHPLRRAAETDLKSLIPEIERWSGLRSRWSGQVWVRAGSFPNAGQKHGWCAISVREDILRHPSRRWRTMIHEGLHSVSGAFSTGRLDARNRVWEEGIVEQTQRLLRQRLLRDLGLALPEAQFLRDDAQHPYNTHIRVLEQLRVAVREEPEPFYRRLLGATIDGRAQAIVVAKRTFGVEHGGGMR